MLPVTRWCANCGAERPLAQLTAFWPVGDPRRVAFVCRPLDPQPPFMNCFREAVGPSAIHAIAPANELPPALAA